MYYGNSGYKSRYEELIQYFIDENIGIIDRTPDIETTIALSDAYIGDAGTSVTSLFGIAGKPLYIMNNNFSEKPAEDDWKAWVNGSVRGDRYDKYSLVLGNRIFEKNDLDNEYHFCCNLPNEYEGGGYYGQVIKEAGKVIIFPANAENILIMNPDDYSFRKIELKHEVGRDGAFHYPTNLIFSDNPEMFYLLPNRYPYLVGFDAKSEKICYIEDEAFSDEYSVYENENMERVVALRFFRVDKGLCAISSETKRTPNIIGNSEKNVVAPNKMKHYMQEISLPEIPGISLKGPKLICIDKTGRRMRAIQLETGKVQERAVQLDGVYTGVLVDINNPDVLWFFPYRGTVLVKWNITNDTWDKVDAAVDGLISIRRPQRTLTQDWYFSDGAFHEDKLILAPNWGNKFVEINVNTNEAREWIPPFSYTTEDKSTYWKNNSIGFFYRDLFDYSLKFFYAADHIIYNLDLYENSVKTTEFVFDKDEVFSLSAGFHKESQWLPYCLFEDVFNPLGEFIKGEVHGAGFDKEKQIDAYRSINASPDGDCGRKVYKAVCGR